MILDTRALERASTLMWRPWDEDAKNVERASLENSRLILATIDRDGNLFRKVAE